jgi:hypothetical protein
MAKSLRIPRTVDELLTAFDHHQYLLRDALYSLRDDLAHAKTLATELRTLVCLSSGTEGLLWRLADELKVSDEVELQVAESVNRNHPLNQGLDIWQIPMHRPGEGPPGPPIEQVRLRDVIKKCEAIYVAQMPDKVFTHELLIGAIAGQMGVAHEAEGLDPTLVKLNNFLVNQRQLYIKVLAFDAELTLQIGERVLDHAEQVRSFCRARRPTNLGDVTLCVRFARTQFLAGCVPMVSLCSPVSETEITCFAGPTSTLFRLTKRGKRVGELRAPYPPNWEMHTDALFTLSYSSAHRQARTITNAQANGQAEQCDLGWLDAREVRLRQHSGYEEFIIPRCVPLYGRSLSSKECGELLKLSPDGRELLAQRPSTGPFPP